MFDDKFIEEYKRIKAPDELYQRILGEEKKENKTSRVVVFRRLTAAAAAIAVIIAAGLALMPRGNQPTVYVNGNELSEAVTFASSAGDGIMLARNFSELSCEIDIRFPELTQVTVHDGILTSEDGTIILSAEGTMDCEASLKAVWTVPDADNSLVYSLSFKDKNGSYRITLYFDGEADYWTAELTK